MKERVSMTRAMFLKWMRLKNHLMGASEPFSETWELFPRYKIFIAIFTIFAILGVTGT